MSFTTDVAFMINTFDRHESLINLVNSIHKVDRKINIYILDDGSNPPVTQYSKKLKHNPYIHVRYQGNKGKKGYWQTCNSLYDWLKEEKIYMFYYHLPDDVVLTDNFLEATQEKWRDINGIDNRIMFLNLISDRCCREKKEALSCWTAYPAVWNEELNVWKTNWIDMAFCTTRTFFNTLQPIPEIKRAWKRIPTLGSGVGSYLSRNFYARKYTMYMPLDSFVEFQDSHQQSKMNPE